MNNTSENEENFSSETPWLLGEISTLPLIKSPADGARLFPRPDSPFWNGIQFSEENGQNERLEWFRFQPQIQSLCELDMEQIGNRSQFPKIDG